MYAVYLAIVRNKDHLLFLFLAIISLFLLLNDENPRMRIVRGKAVELVSFLSSPLTVAKSLLFLEEENQLLREKTLALSLQVESMLNLHKENEELLSLLDFKKKTTLKIRPARVVNKGTQPNLLSIVIDGGKIDGIKRIRQFLHQKG